MKGSMVENCNCFYSQMRFMPDRQDKDKRIFKGSANVTFKSRELAEAFMTLPTVKYNENTLLRQWK